VAGNASIDPPGAPGALYDFWVAPIVNLFADTIEGGAGPWTHGPVTGGWGDQWHVSTERNHTAGGTRSWKCGDSGTGGYAARLDAGLVTPVVELIEGSFLHYWQWIEARVNPASPTRAFDAGLVEISADGGPWTQIFPDSGYTHRIQVVGSMPGPFADGTEVFSGTVDWIERRFELSAYEGPVRLRFRFGTDGGQAAEGWHIDDVMVDGFQIDVTAVEAPAADARLALRSVTGNPFAGSTTLAYELPQPTAVALQVFDLGGRLVRTLVRGEQAAGTYTVNWNGRDEADHPVPTGVYLSRLRAGQGERTARLILTR